MPRVLRRVLVVLLVAAALELGLRVASRLYLQRLYTTAYQAQGPRPGDINVICLGESSTAGAWVAPAESYPRQLQALLRNYYRNPRVRTIVPPHLGQNTSQMSKRIGGCISLYRPRLVVLMAGHDNEWSLAESHVGRFLKGSDRETLELKASLFLERFRLFRLLRHGYFRFVANERSRYSEQNRPSVKGLNKRALIDSWRSDLHDIFREAKGHGARVLLMTYPMNPSYLPADEWVALAREESVPLVRNDASFEAFATDGTIGDHLLDGRHPSAAGYAVIARNAFQRVRDDDLLGLAGRPSPMASRRPAPPPGYPPVGSGRLELALPKGGPYLGRGWSWPETWDDGPFRWTDGPRADVFFALEPPGARVARFRLVPYLELPRHALQRVDVEINGRPAGRLSLDEPGPYVRSVGLPASDLRKDNVLSLHLPDAASPKSLGVSEDPRRLGIAVQWLALEAPPECPPGGRIDLGSPRAQPYLGPGWSEPEDGVRWVVAPRAQLFFGAKRGRVLRLKIVAVRPPRRIEGVPLVLEANGRRLASLRLTMMDPMPTVYALPLPGEGANEEYVVSFELPGRRQADEGDPEPPALAIEWLEVAR